MKIKLKTMKYLTLITLYSEVQIVILVILSIFFPLDVILVGFIYGMILLGIIMGFLILFIPIKKEVKPSDKSAKNRMD